MYRSQEEEGGVSRRPSLGSQEESGEDLRKVQHIQSGRTMQRSPVDPVLGFKEEPGLKARESRRPSLGSYEEPGVESRWVHPSTQEEPGLGVQETQP